MAKGIQIRHRTARSCMVTVPVVKKPFREMSVDKCPTCNVMHPVKTVHLWLDDSGACLVSEGVLGELKLAGLPDLDVVGHTDNPPPLAIGVPRELVDRNNRRLWFLRKRWK